MAFSALEQHDKRNRQHTPLDKGCAGFPWTTRPKHERTASTSQDSKWPLMTCSSSSPARQCGKVSKLCHWGSTRLNYRYTLDHASYITFFPYNWWLSKLETEYVWPIGGWERHPFIEAIEVHVSAAPKGIEFEPLWSEVRYRFWPFGSK